MATPNEIKERLKQWKPLVVGMAYRFRKRLSAGHELEDVVAIGMVALWQAAENYDDTKGATFGTYARRVVLYKYLGEVKALNASNRKVAYASRQSLDAEHADGTPMFHFAAEGRDPEAAMIQDKAEQRMLSAMRELPPTHKMVVRDRHLRDKSFEEIGQALGVTRQRAQQIEVEALKRMRRSLSA